MLVLLIRDIIWECEIQNRNGLIVIIDYPKAFDSISRDFFLKTLDIFNIGPEIQKWVRSL